MTALARVGGQVLDLARLVRKPGPANTGPGAESLTAYAGPMTITTPGTTIASKVITGTLTIAADDVTITTCRLEAVPNVGTYLIQRTGTPARFVITDSILDGKGISGEDAGPYPSGWSMSAPLAPGWGYTLRRCELRGFTDTLKPQDNPTPILVDRCWLHAVAHYYSAAGVQTHNDVMQIAGGGATDVLVTGCTLDGYNATAPTVDGRYASSSAMQWGSYPGDVGALRNVVIERCWIDGGAYASRLNAVGLAVCQGVALRNNLIGLRHRYGVFTGTTSSTDGGQITATGNRWATTGTTDYGLAVTAGELVP